MKNKAQYEIIFEIVRSEIIKWDPYELIQGGAPDDEFDQEIAQIVAKLENITLENDLKTIIAGIFSKTFESEHFTPIECGDVANKIEKSLSKIKCI
ncbi:hypothetical protein DESUT3_21180 [Desulfuromonas versatilis]|uniref:DUF1871 domain-containing protein n=1 Tax=Desulfuromonas versatilis TaxID=2802975 RepID=A0ABN6DZT8_9BACT|nr:DUF1871 family protein [Desulfuromonas versatilis]BCR05049.1 hypothetical protein DESUT3_21180 [Desulfuromonas versatilis]